MKEWHQCFWCWSGSCDDGLVGVAVAVSGWVITVDVIMEGSPWLGWWWGSGVGVVP